MSHVTSTNDQNEFCEISLIYAHLFYHTHHIYSSSYSRDIARLHLRRKTGD